MILFRLKKKNTLNRTVNIMFDIINKPLGYVLSFLADIFSNDFAVAVAVFTLLINVVLIPLSIKSQKSAVSQMRIKPKLDELKKKYGDDRQKMAMAQQELYKQEGVSMSGGCLPMIIRLVLMMSIYSLIMSPLTYMSNVGSKEMNNVYTTVQKLNPEAEEKYEGTTQELYDMVIADLGWKSNNTNRELALVNNINGSGKTFKEVLVDKDYKDEKLDKLAADVYEKIKSDVDKITQKYQKKPINFNLLGSEKLDMTKTPEFEWNVFEAFQLLWIIPIGAFLAQIVTGLISMRVNKINNPDAPSMKFMILGMPLISLFIGFGLPGGVGFYWICSSLIGGLIQSGVQLWYGPHKMLARERAKELNKQCDFETKQIEKFSKDSESIIKD